MNEVVWLALTFSAGISLGAFFFGGLWWTVRKGVASEQPAFWFLGSLLLRMSVALAGLYLVSGGHWERLLSCCAGFVVARLAVTRLIRSIEGGRSRPVREASHAP
jgi:F1F0 ATPase subunit 2